MISILEVEHFQAWKHGVLEFDPGVNIIKGTSHSGKSSLIRSFDWIFNNRPISDEMRPWSDEKKKLDIIASVGFDDESFISRVKKKKFNGYESSTGELEALNRDVPTEISILANMAENLHRQDDGYFLLNESPGNVARVLNRKSGLEDIDIIQKATKGLISELQSDLKRNKQNKAELQQELDKLTQLSKLRPKFDNLSKMIADFTKKQKFKNDLIRHLQNIQAIDVAIADFEHFISREKQVKKISHLLQEVVDTETQVDSLSALVDSIEYRRSSIEKISYFVSKSEKIFDIKDKLTYLKEIKENYEQIKSLLTDIQLREKHLKMYEHNLKHMEPKKAELEKQREELSEYCSKCGAHKKYWKVK